MKYTDEQLKPIIKAALDKKYKAIREMREKGIVLPSEKILAELNKQADDEIAEGRQKLLDL